MTIQSPTPAQIIAARKAANLLQKDACTLIHAALGSWKKWESGDRTMHPAMWELFLLKTGAALK